MAAPQLCSHTRGAVPLRGKGSPWAAASAGSSCPRCPQLQPVAGSQRSRASALTRPRGGHQRRSPGTDPRGTRPPGMGCRASSRLCKRARRLPPPHPREGRGPGCWRCDVGRSLRPRRGGGCATRRPSGQLRVNAEALVVRPSEPLAGLRGLRPLTPVPVCSRCREARGDRASRQALPRRGQRGRGVPRGHHQAAALQPVLPVRLRREREWRFQRREWAGLGQHPTGAGAILTASGHVPRPGQTGAPPQASQQEAAPPRVSGHAVLWARGTSQRSGLRWTSGWPRSHRTGALSLPRLPWHPWACRGGEAGLAPLTVSPLVCSPCTSARASP